MDFTLPETAGDVAGLARDIASSISTDEHVAALETARAPIDEDLWRALGAAGLLGLELPSTTVGEHGGDLSPVENLTAAGELGRVLARVPFGPHAVAAAPVIARRGSDSLRAAVLPDAAAGTAVLSVAFEEDPGSDPRLPATTLRAADDGYTLAGSKVNVPYASVADVLLVNVIGPQGAAVVAVPTDDPRVVVVDTPSTGLTPTAQVDFDDVAITADRILDGGAITIDEVTDRLMLALCADQSGVVESALSRTAEYAREREQFGKPIGEFQAVAQRLADGYIDVQGLALTTTQATWLLAQGDDADATELQTAVATAKFWAAEAGHRVAHTAVHVHGGVGLDTSHPVHRYFLRAAQNEFSVGSAPITLRRIGATLANQPA